MSKLAWQDVVAFVAGLAVVLAPVIWATGADAAEQPMMLLGALLVVAALWPLLGAVGPTTWVRTAIAALIFVSPWAFDFAGDTSASWTAWIAAGVAVIVGVWDAVRSGGRTKKTAAA